MNGNQKGVIADNAGGMVQHLSRKLIPLSTGIAMLIAVLAPVTSWILAHRNLQHMVSLYAEDLADHLRQVVQESPTFWKYQTYKFITIAEGFHPNTPVSGFRILDEKGELITGHDYNKVRWEKPGKNLSFTEEFKSTLGTAPIMFNDRRVGTVEVLTDDTRLLRTSALLFCFWSLVGIALAVLAYLLPVRVVRKMDGAVNERTRQLVETQEQLLREEKLAMLGRIAGNMGNELRNPLGVMSNAVFFLQTVLPDADETVREYLEIIGKEIGNSQHIISDLTDFCSGRAPRTEPVAVHELIYQSRVKCTIPDNIRFQADLPETLPNVQADPLQMELVFQHLIANAVQAMPEGGALRIAARRVLSSEFRVLSSNLKAETSDPKPDTDMPLTSELMFSGSNSKLKTQNSKLDGDFVEISVTDSGEGIAPENMEKVFQPLFSTKSRGIGLGLAISQQLTAANGGRIEVESELGKGTTFKVILPNCIQVDN